MATDICLQVQKFSHATGQRPDNTIPWSHIQAPDIFLLVNGHNDGPLSLQVVQGTSTLESVELGAYIDKAIRIRRGVEQAGITPSIEQLPIFGIAKENILALRYRLENNEPRRLQLRLQRLSDSQQLVAVLARRGLEFQEQRPRTARPGSGTSESTASKARLDASDNEATRAAPQSTLKRANPFALREYPMASSWEQQSVCGQLRSPPRAFRHEEKRYVHQSTMPMADALHGREERTLPSSQSRGNPYDLQNSTSKLLFNPRAERRLRSADAGHCGAQREDSAPDNADTFPKNTDLAEGGSFVPCQSQVLLPSSSSTTVPRPASSASAACPATMSSQSFVHELPPRRVLPFRRPESRQSDSAPPDSRPGSSALDLPSFKRPSVSQGNKATLPSDRPASPLRPGPSRLQVDLRARLSTPVSPNQENTGNIRLAAGVGTSSGSMKPSSMVPVDHPESRPAPMKELLFGRRPSFINQPQGNTSDALHDSSPPNVANGPTQMVLPALQPSTSSQKADLDAGISGLAALAPRVDEQEKSSLSGYAAQSKEDRVAALDDFIVEHLNDPAFTVLCADVENCWRRIALGL